MFDAVLGLALGDLLEFTWFEGEGKGEKELFLPLSKPHQSVGVF